MAKKLKPNDEAVAAETPVYAGQSDPLDVNQFSIEDEVGTGRLATEQPIESEIPLDASGNFSTTDEVDEPLTSDDRGEPEGRVLATAGTPDTPAPDKTHLAPEPKPAKVWKPGSCINCGETTTDAVQVIAVDRFRCTRCQHEWTPAKEQAPFRRLARR